MNLLLLGHDYFARAFRDLGCVVQVPRMGDSDPHLPELLNRLTAKPDAVVLTDDLGRRTLPSGWDECDVKKVYYAVDSPINLFWQRHFAALFDLVLVDQKPQVEKLDPFTNGETAWMPVAVDTKKYQGPGEAKRFDIGFVGVLDERVRPKRSRIIDILSRHFRIKTAGGRKEKWFSTAQAAALYRQSRLVLNENLFPGVTTRMFEAMASGAMLLTESADDGLTDLFEPGRDLACFGPDDLLERAAAYISDAVVREKIAARGRDLVLERHDIRHRAERALELIARARPGTGVTNAADHDRSLGNTLFLAGMRRPKHNGLDRVIKAERLLSRSLEAKADDPETRFHLGLISRLKNDHRAAARHFRAAWDQGSLRALPALGYLALEDSSLQAAESCFRTAAHTAGLDFPRCFPRGGGLSADQHTALARTLESAGHGLCPGFSRYHLDMAMWTALEHYRAALEKAPDHVAGLRGLGELLAAHGAYTEAYPFLERAAGLAPASPEAIDTLHRIARLGYLDPAARKVA